MRFLMKKKVIVIGNSMSPFIKDGDILICDKQDEYNIGDVVLIKTDKFFCHRIILCSKDKSFYLTKGDNSLEPDGWLRKDKIIGKVKKDD